MLRSANQISFEGRVVRRKMAARFDHFPNAPMDIEVPRDRKGTFAPQLIPKHARQFTGLDDKILAFVRPRIHGAGDRSVSPGDGERPKSSVRTVLPPVPLR
jgi:hypothetical protein